MVYNNLQDNLCPEFHTSDEVVFSNLEVGLIILIAVPQTDGGQQTSRVSAGY